MAQFNVVLKDPQGALRGDLKPRVERELAKLAHLVASTLKSKQYEDRKKEAMATMVRLMVGQVQLGSMDVLRAQMQARGLKAVLENTTWLTAEEVGRAGKLSDSNFGAPASRWKKEGKLFSILHDGLERFPAYALDESYRPLAAIATVMKRLGAIRGWRMAVWFESSNAWLDGDRPRVRIQSEPTAVIEAAQHYRNISHG